MEVGLEMLKLVIIRSAIEMLLRFIGRRLNRDPATASTSLIISSTEVLGILIHFAIVRTILTLPSASDKI